MDPDLNHQPQRPGGSQTSPPAAETPPLADTDTGEPADPLGPPAGGQPGAPPSHEPVETQPPGSEQLAPRQAEAEATPLESSGMLVLGGTPLAAERTEPVESQPAPRDVCRDCGGTFGNDGYCDTCGAARPDERLHYSIEASRNVAGVCDRGIRHITNEDALAVAADDDGARHYAMIVSDGVSTAPRAAQASTAAVQAALAVLTSTRSTGLAGIEAALIGALNRRLVAAAEAAADAVREVTERPDDGTPDTSGIPKAGHPACTLVAGIVEGDVAAVGSIGDSRAYWLPDSGPDNARRLTTDDSWANEQIRLGVDPAEAERGRHAHTITKWLGVDCTDTTPEVTTVTLTEPGYLFVCSDGLWNYASAPHELATALRNARAGLSPDASALDVAASLVDWANARGGQDNVTVAVARIASVGGDVHASGPAGAGVAVEQPARDQPPEATHAEGPGATAAHDADSAVIPPRRDDDTNHG